MKNIQKAILLFLVGSLGTMQLMAGVTSRETMTQSSTVILPTIPADTFKITSYGAVSSTTIDNTSSIQQTINACSTAGGGVVLFPTGTFLSGPLTMKSKINLCIASGSILRILPYGSGNGTVAGTYPNSGTLNDYTDFIYGKSLSNIAITGTGTIDGNGTDWWTAYRASSGFARPCLIRFDACTYVLISGIKLLNAPNVHLTIGKSGSNATLKNLTITAPSTAPNTDGIDTWSPNINILNCNIAVGDDNIAMDSGSQNITVKNCVFGTGHGCSVGSYASNVGNIIVDSCSFTNTTSGIRLKTARDRGGLEQYFTYSNITMTGVATPFYATSYYPKEPTSPSIDPAQAITSSTPTWQHLLFKNITVTGSPNAGILWGLPEQSISDVVFDNVSIAATTGMKAYFVSGLVFKNGSHITVSSGSAVTTYSTSVSGIELTTGKSAPTGFDKVTDTRIKCYPNPLTNGYLTLISPLNILQVKIYSLIGTKVMDFSSNSVTLNLNLSDLPKGLYVIRVLLNDNTYYDNKIIIS
ncbi:MAG: glycosyl hydrolase family 28 protein [Paludibacter sp.]|nr:glycosyl hydrolase family 28 protein [Paludibacter sp.]